MADQQTPVHGGQVRAAAHRYHIPVQHWLDLSTGINPQGWPVPAPPQNVWQRLPEEEDGLRLTTTAFFGTTAVLPVAGAQAAIQSLPRLRAPGRVGILSPTYAEHAHRWQDAGHTVTTLNVASVESEIDALDVLVVVNPDNPSGRLIEPDRLYAWQKRLSAHAGWLVVDEAFIDATPAYSLVGSIGEPGLIVLRSLGKFWGLAGVRAGFVLAERELLDALEAQLGPWHISHPARWIAQRALTDSTWRDIATSRLQQDSARLAALLDAHGMPSPSGCALFRWVPTPRAAELFESFARHGVLVRCFPELGLRFGLPGSEEGWQKLEQVLREVAA